MLTFEQALEKLLAAGATEVVPEALESSVMLATHALALSGIPVLECSYGTVSGNYALKVETILSGAQELFEPPPSGEQEDE